MLLREREIKIRERDSMKKVIITAAIIIPKNFEENTLSNKVKQKSRFCLHI